MNKLSEIEARDADIERRLRTLDLNIAERDRRYLLGLVKEMRLVGKSVFYHISTEWEREQMRTLLAKLEE